ncbi:winged helix-turn-helix domain-containing protein [Halegenticoccus soli]|uniref:winged helix-turn-helix domain-containing protein n=1 Tax=Halegenticoccus soli TaxID=1985678 RepID=UPI000C6CC6EC|nr:winged helix-turn-helix domain-containing protein [Halegenticoccus soli]
MPESIESRVRDLPPSSKLVFKVIERNGRLTQGQIAAESMLSARTVRYALDRLKGVDAVRETVYLPDARKSVYALADGDDEELAPAW